MAKKVMAMFTELNPTKKVYKVIYRNTETNEIDQVFVEAANSYWAGQQVMNKLYGLHYELLKSQNAKPEELN